MRWADGKRADDRIPDRFGRRGADGAELPDRRRARPGLHFRRLLLSQPPPRRGGSIAMLNARPRMSEILRILPGSSVVVAPSNRDLTAPEVAAGLEESFSGGGYTARQRSALLQMAWDHVSSALDGRE